MASPRVNPTRMELTRIKRRQKTAVRGHKLLKDKHDEMVRQFMLLIRQNERLRRETEELLSGALREFAMAMAVMDEQSVQDALLCPVSNVELTAKMQNIMSVEVPQMELKLDSQQLMQLPYGFAETSAQLDGAIATITGLLPRLIELAQVEKTCERLADEIDKTRRRVNALEYVLIPQMQDTARMITMKLEENERGNLTRLMKVKEMLADRN